MKRTGLILATLAVLALGVAGYASLATKPATVPSTHVTERVLTPPTVQELLDAVNAERAKAGVAPLTLDTRLNTSAQVKADDMVATNDLDHVDANGKHGYEYAMEYNSDCKVPSENISTSTLDYRNTLAVVDGWMSSKPHHDAMLNPSYSTTGFGIVWGDTMVVVQHFCTVK